MTRTLRLPILLAAALSLPGCGGEEVDAEPAAAGAEGVLHVRAEGMVKSLGIT